MALFTIQNEFRYDIVRKIFEGGMGIDATVPYGYEQDFHRPVYPVDKVDPRRFFGEAELAQAKQRVRGWMEVLARTGR